MKRTKITSSRISSVGWENNTLEVEFKNGSVYQYPGVVYSEYMMLINSASPGTTFSIIEKAHTKNRIF